MFRYVVGVFEGTRCSNMWLVFLGVPDDQICGWCFGGNQMFRYVVGVLGGTRCSDMWLVFLGVPDVQICGWCF